MHIQIDDRDSWAATASFPPDPHNVVRSRLLTRTALASWGLPRLAGDAEIVVSELVTNAVRYGRGTVSLALALAGEQLRISVSDGSPELPVRAAGPDDEAQGGRGLLIVEALCDGLRVTPRPAGKTVSCRLTGAAGGGSRAVDPPGGELGG
ncbi:ATP-binding protein [Streptomyces sp. NPDC092296]|uniref:ATP-binding protein n=1 Tax=Streptomyces sp. NPDC092296 TaxID=3366012 RepID=UPI0037FA9CC3